MLTNVTLPEGAILAAIGYGVVFAGLVVLMLVIMLLGKAFSAKKKKAAEPAPVAAPVEVEVISDAPLAPGSAGELKLYDTPSKTAAMLMAIVADKLGKPLNELRFISIKEVK